MAANSNPARGEVAFTLAGQAFRLVATAENVAALESETVALGLRDIIARLNAVNLATIRLGLVLLDADEREAAERKMKALSLPDLVAAGDKVVAALLFGLQRGNAPGAAASKSA